MGGLLSSVGGGLLHLVLPSLATILAGLAVSFVQKKAQQAGIDLTQAQTDLLKTEVTHAVQGAEEYANRRATSGSPMTGSEKKNLATETAAKALPDVPISKVTAMIDAVLPEVRSKMAAGIAAGMKPVVAAR